MSRVQNKKGEKNKLNFRMNMNFFFNTISEVESTAILEKNNKSIATGKKLSAQEVSLTRWQHVVHDWEQE